MSEVPGQARNQHKAVLSAGFASIALRMQEASAGELSNGDVCNRLRDALSDIYRGTGNWAYYIDHFGDADSGDVIYSVNSDTKRAPYAIATVAGKAACTVDTDKAVDVMPRTIYEEEADDEDHYAAMEAAKLYKSKSEFPLYERFISRDERKSAGSGSFAGKGKSFPILKPSDVMAAVRSIGRAGSDNYDAGTLKRNIIKIAKAKGWGKELPKAWRGDGTDSAEAAAPVNGQGDLRLVESAATLEPIVLREARSDYEIKLIAPGKGSSAFYPREVLQRDGPKVFKAGTHVYLNHATAAEEAARPEGDVKNLAGVLTTNATYSESHAKGEGLYARMKVFADHATVVEEKAPHVGMSIRAAGVAESGKMREGVPVLKELTRAESVDVVTRAGAGGLILTEAARPPNPNEGGADDMDAAELKSLKESLAAREANEKKLLERAIRGDAREFTVRTLKSITLHEAGKELVIESVLGREVPQKDGAVDEAKLKEAIDAEAKRVGAAIAAATGSGQVRGMGAGLPPVPIDAKEAEARAANEKAAKEQRLKESMRAFRDMGMPEEAAKRAAMRGEAA
jgi:hypothetical protein